MFAPFSRYITAFWKALMLTLRGKTLQPPDKHPELTAWMQKGLQLTHTVLTTADAHGLDTQRRTALILRVDKRDIAMQTILAAVQHNLTREYPLLIQSQVEYYHGAIQALNMNDCYRIEQLAHALKEYPAVQHATQTLHTHLAAFPAESITIRS